MRRAYSSRLWKCPYFEGDERQAIHCEGGTVTFIDRATDLRYATAYCCNAWERCTLARALNQFYGEEE